MSTNPLNDMRIIEYYLPTFPTDDLGEEINPTATFDGLLQTLDRYEDVYDYIGVADSLLRERIFEELARLMDVSYTAIYSQWLMAED